MDYEMLSEDELKKTLDWRLMQTYELLGKFYVVIYKGISRWDGGILETNADTQKKALLKAVKHLVEKGLLQS